MPKDEHPPPRTNFVQLPDFLYKKAYMMYLHARVHIPSDYEARRDQFFPAKNTPVQQRKTVTRNTKTRIYTHMYIYHVNTKRAVIGFFPRQKYPVTLKKKMVTPNTKTFDSQI
jgi:hypothetical protein